MSIKVCSLLAFTISPLVCVMYLHVVPLVWAQWTLNNAMDIFRGFQIGIITVILVYILLIVFSVPIFHLIRKMFGWSWWSCQVASYLLITIFVSLVMYGATSSGNSFEHNLELLFLLWSASLLYGLVFWLIVREK